MYPSRILSAAIITAFVITTSIMQTNGQQNKFAEGIHDKPFIHLPRGSFNPTGTHATYRSYDGTNNNTGFQKGQWGATDIPLYRELPAEYAATDPNNAMAGSNRPSPREISNAVCDEPVTQFSTSDMLVRTINWKAGNQDLQIPVNELPAGMYLLKLMSSQSTKSFRFVKATN